MLIPKMNRYQLLLTHFMVMQILATIVNPKNYSLASSTCLIHHPVPKMIPTMSCSTRRSMKVQAFRIAPRTATTRTAAKDHRHSYQLTKHQRAATRIAAKNRQSLTHRQAIRIAAKELHHLSLSTTHQAIRIAAKDLHHLSLTTTHPAIQIVAKDLRYLFLSIVHHQATSRIPTSQMTKSLSTRQSLSSTSKRSPNFQTSTSRT